MVNSWTHLKNDMFQEAYEKATEEYISSNSLVPLRHRAIASMLLRQYEGALCDRLEVLGKTSELDRGDDDYINIGVAYWLLGNHDDAQKAWIDSMTLKLRYTTNIVSPAAITFFAGVYLKEPKTIKQATKYLKRYQSRNITLACFLLNGITEKDLLETIKFDDPLKDRKLCKYEFYIAVKNLEQDNIEGFYKHLINCREAKGHYLEFEYFLAIGELEKQKKS